MKKEIRTASLTLTLSEDCRRLASLIGGERSLLSDVQKPLFTLRTRDRTGKAALFSAADAAVTADGDTIRYAFESLSVVLTICEGEGGICFGFSVENRSDLAPEFIDLPSVTFGGALRDNGGDCAIVSGFNEGMLVTDSTLKPTMIDPEFPSNGSYMMYPYMVSVPLMMWLFGGEGISMEVRDAAFAPKGLDFCCTADKTEFRTRLFLGGNYGESLTGTSTVVWKHFRGSWEDGARSYRDYADANLGAKQLRDLTLPDWYKNDMPLVITYPVRGQHDMDEMYPNKLFPYGNVLPLVDEFAERTGAKIMVLLMHWEGTAPWAPPYVWPPYGGETVFNEFMDALHRRGDLLGVYCSGLGFTEQSNLIAEYNLAGKIESENLGRGFTRAPDQSMPKSIICRGQRSGYDICPVTETGRRILDEALSPLLGSGVDYVQALDQNHGGGMYFCYASDHGHPPVPGAWMTEASRELLAGWKASCPNTLLGCESAAAEPYIDSLRLSDNRYELCYRHGQAIPLYAFLFHKYLHNFMGNQVACPIGYTTEGLNFRIAYSFTAGDLITLVLNDVGEIMFHWGMRDFSKKIDRDAVMTLCAELHRFHTMYPALFRDGEMTTPLAYTADTVEIPCDKKNLRVPAVLASAWETEGRLVQLLVNYTDMPRTVTLEKSCTVRRSDNTVETAAVITLAPYSAAALEI